MCSQDSSLQQGQVTPHSGSLALKQNKVLRSNAYMMLALSMDSGARVARLLGQVLIVLSLWLVISTAQAQTVAALACSPSTIGGGSGGSAICTVTLTSAAPAGGTLVTLTSSPTELAATVPTITIPAGQTSMNFSVGTNTRYRAYSLLSFTATITATANATSQSAILNITAQPRPADFTNPNTAADASPWQGSICGRRAIINGGGAPEILYNCSLPNDGSFGVCTFQQECSIACQSGTSNNFRANDFCAITGPNPVAISSNRVIGGERVPATLHTVAPVTTLTQGLPGAISNQGQPGAINGINVNASVFPIGGITIPSGTSSAGFAVATSIVPAVTFVDVVSTVDSNEGERGGHAWLALAPPNPAPALPIPTLGDFKITGSNPVTGGQSSIGQLDVSGISSGGGPTITFTSSHPSIVPAPASIVMPPSTVLGQQVTLATQPPATNTNVTITATDGLRIFSTVLTVLAPGPAPILAGVSVNPGSVIGGNASTGTVTLSAAQSGVTVVTLDEPFPVTVASHPTSVSVPAGQTSANFTITTAPRTEAEGTFNFNIYARLSGTTRQALLLITPGPAALSSVSMSPSSVVGGSSSTGTVTLSAAAPSGGAVVALADNSTAVTVPASATVAAGATSASFTATSSTVTASTTATITATYNNVSQTAALTVNPATVTLVAPTLVSPSDGARFSVGTAVTFDWSDVTGAASYTIEIDNSSSIAAPLVTTQTMTASQTTISGLPKQKMWWRVRANNSAGNAGPWSAVRGFEMR